MVLNKNPNGFRMFPVRIVPKTIKDLQVLRFQLTDLKYDSQIASAMLARQQAVAQVDAKRALVHGAAETASSTVARLKLLGHTFSHWEKHGDIFFSEDLEGFCFLG